VAVGYSRGADTAKQFAAAHEGSTIHQGNIGVAADCERVISEVLEQHGQLDILVNNAGITIDRTVRKMSWRTGTGSSDVNLSGPFYLSRAVLQHMLDRGYGRIINISSVIGEKGNIGQANYAAAKSGLFGLTNSLALGDGPQGDHGQLGRARVHRHRDGLGHARGGPGQGGRSDPGGPPGRAGRDCPGGRVPWPTPSRGTSPGRCTASTAGCTCEANNRASLV
jgi:hypothetical protein